MFEFPENSKLTIYSGIPKRKNPEERSKWQKFLGFLLPFLSHKYELGERYLAAKVLHEEAEAFKALAEGLNSFESARKIAREATAIEERKMQDLGKDTFTEQDISAMAEQIAIKLNHLKVVKDLHLNAEIKQKIAVKNEQTIDKQQ